MENDVDPWLNQFSSHEQVDIFCIVELALLYFLSQKDHLNDETKSCVEIYQNLETKKDIVSFREIYEKENLVTSLARLRYGKKIGGCNFPSCIDGVELLLEKISARSKAVSLETQRSTLLHSSP